MRRLVEGDSKVCTKCKIEKPIGDFYKLSNRPSHSSSCKSCQCADTLRRQKANPEKQREKAKRWRENNPERYRDVWTKYRAQNEEVMRVRCLEWRHANREYANEATRRWAKANPELTAAQAAKRRACQRNATPSWSEIDKIKEVYALARRLTVETGVKHHVDHIVPLVNDFVSGLHVFSNLRVITATENHIKRNSFSIGV